MLGMLLLRGEEIISLTIEGPPPAEETRPLKQQVAPVSPAFHSGAPAPAFLATLGRACALAFLLSSRPLHGDRVLLLLCLPHRAAASAGRAWCWQGCRQRPASGCARAGASGE